MVKIIECPRDAMQGLETMIPASEKIRYLDQLLKVGFDTIDIGSFVSPKAVPQMADTAEVLQGIDLHEKASRLLVIIANVKGALEALKYDQVDLLGFPLSLSETFQKKNTNRSIEEAFQVIADVKGLLYGTSKKLVTYLSMGFGNPYGDAYDRDHVIDFVHRLEQLGVDTVSLSDTVGVAEDDNIHWLFSTLIPAFPQIEFGAHFHAHPLKAKAKLQAAWAAGCRRFDVAMSGFGGCPMAMDELVGNIATETLVSFLKGEDALPALNDGAFKMASLIATEIFPAR